MEEKQIPGVHYCCGAFCSDDGCCEYCKSQEPDKEEEKDNEQQK